MTTHIPVLLQEVIENLNIDKGDAVLDCTVGGGGYFEKFCELVGKKGIVIGTDQDEDGLKRASKKLSENKKCLCQKFLIKNNFRNLDEVLKNLKIQKVNKIVFDLGLSSDQFEQSGRGFSFQKNEPLLMTFNKDGENLNFTARDIVNDWNEENIADILFGYGEEKFSRRIAKKIIEERKKKEIETTFDLVEIIKEAVPVWYRTGRKIHPATKTFQALRIAVNDEISSLEDGLLKGFENLEKSGRMAVVSFHSIEDRMVKNFMRDKKKTKEGILITKKPIVSSREEIKKNPRARSAKLRVIEKV